MTLREITFAYSPNPEDIFMFYPIIANKMSTYPYIFRTIKRDIQTLNERAVKVGFDVTAISLHTYCYIKKHYFLARCGASMGYKCGPVVVSKSEINISKINEKVVAIPGTMTTAFLLLRLAVGDFDYMEVPIEQILLQVACGEIEVGLLIRSGRADFEQYGLKKIIDLGEWWYERTNLPVPLRVVSIKKGLGIQTASEIAKIIHDSVIYGFEHQDEALEYTAGFTTKLSIDKVKKCVEMYVNEWTIDVRKDGEEAIEELIKQAETRKLVPPTLPIEYL